MRTIPLALALVAVMVGPSVLAEPVSAAFLFVHRVEQETAFLAWNVDPAASMYIVYRGESLETLEAYAITPDPFFLDDNVLTDRVVYGVAATDGQWQSETIWVSSGGRGSCVTTGSGGRVTVNLDHCVMY